MSSIHNRPILIQQSLSCTAKHGSIYYLLLLALLALEIPWAAAQSSPPNNPYAYAKFSPSMAIIVVVLISALFFMGFFAVYIRHCAGAQSGNSVAARVFSRRTAAAAARGLDQEVIDTFPTLAYSTVKGLKIGKSALECAVCLNEFEDHETLRLIPKCDHVFHPDCIDAWLGSHTTCPVCRANLVPQPGESLHLPVALNNTEELDVEAQNDAVLDQPTNKPEELQREREEQGPEELNVKQTLNRNRTRNSRSGRARWLPFPRSHSTGHSLVQPGENTERFTLRLPVEVRKQLMNRHLSRATSMVLLPREGSSRRGYRTGTGGEGSSGGKSYRRLEKGDRMFKSDRWVFSMTPPFLMRASSLKSPKVVAATDGEGTSSRPEGSGSNSVRPPV